MHLKHCIRTSGTHFTPCNVFVLPFNWGVLDQMWDILAPKINNSVISLTAYDSCMTL